MKNCLSLKFKVVFKIEITQTNLYFRKAKAMKYTFFPAQEGAFSIECHTAYKRFTPGTQSRLLTHQSVDE